MSDPVRNPYDPPVAPDPETERQRIFRPLLFVILACAGLFLLGILFFRTSRVPNVQQATPGRTMNAGPHDVEPSESP